MNGETRLMDEQCTHQSNRVLRDFLKSKLRHISNEIWMLTMWIKLNTVKNFMTNFIWYSMTCIIIIMQDRNQALVSAYWDLAVAQMAKKSACNAGDLGSIPWSGRFPGEGNGSPLQYSCLENSMDREALWATVHAVAKSQTWLSD